MDHVRRVVIGLGSNLGDRQAQLVAAADRIAADAELRVLRRSAVYESEPAGGPAQGDYLNSAVLVVTSLPAREIVRRVMDIERALGRERPDPVRWGPRIIDLDVLWIEGEAVDEPDVSVPHKHLRERAFAVQPLVEVAPDATDPHTREPYATLPAATAPLRRVAD